MKPGDRSANRSPVTRNPARTCAGSAGGTLAVAELIQTHAAAITAGVTADTSTARVGPRTGDSPARYVGRVIDQLHALHASVERLRSIVESLDPIQLSAPAYPSEWTIADTLSHLGSGAVIMRATLDAIVSGIPVAPGYSQTVWDEWNAKSPADQAAGVVGADHALLERAEALTESQRASLQFPFGPMTVSVPEALGMRLNEHAVHTWDVEVMLDPAAVLSEGSSRVILGSLPMIARFAAKDDGVARSVTVRTSEPTKEFVLATGAGSVSLHPGAGDGPVVEMPAESFVRLVYGRLDTDHTPAALDPAEIASLRPLFPGL